MCVNFVCNHLATKVFIGKLPAMGWVCTCMCVCVNLCVRVCMIYPFYLLHMCGLLFHSIFLYILQEVLLAWCSTGGCPEGVSGVIPSPRGIPYC